MSTATPDVQIPQAGGRWLLGAAGVSVLTCCAAGVLGCGGYLSDPAAGDFTSTVVGVPLLALVLAALVGMGLGAWAGWTDERGGRSQPRALVLVATVLLGALPAVVAYLVARWIAARQVRSDVHLREQQAAAVWADWERYWATVPDGLAAARELASRDWGRPGAVAGLVLDPPARRVRVASPRGAALVIGPPASGKTTAVIIPSVLVAPGAVVASSIKLDVALATAAVRGRLGRCWVFDPGGDPGAVPGMELARWSPLVGLDTWDDARQVASRIAMALRGGDDGDDNNMAHFIDKARDWLEIFLYAARLSGADIGTVASWAGAPDQPATLARMDEVLRPGGAIDSDSEGPGLAREQLAGLLTIEPRERGSIRSTLARMVRIYGAASARRSGADPNFVPDTFVRSTDTLYIVTPPERVAEYGPVIGALLEAIRHATYRRHAAEETGREPRRPHLTMCLDEVTNTAPIDVSSIVSEGGGQSLHVIVGTQDLALVRAKFGAAADSWLTVFRCKIALPGILDPYTLDALSKASGEYDRTVVSVSQSTSHLTRWHIRHTRREPSWSTQSTPRLRPGDIAQIPEGAAIVWTGATWSMIDCPGFYSEPVWLAAMRPAVPVYGDRPPGGPGAGGQNSS
ncbi:type IV secretory system conjugative DNA transfer family protein [Longispora sp. NPDC051575]|uniref:type IV secretory system conjugative DNA transfer family protein n=1 Tax=Longispora sp. NPDC051575 TaxID=3154943 RepID=UPI00343C4211